MQIQLRETQYYPNVMVTDMVFFFKFMIYCSMLNNLLVTALYESVYNGYLNADLMEQKHLRF